MHTIRILVAPAVLALALAASSAQAEPNDRSGQPNHAVGSASGGAASDSAGFAIQGEDFNVKPGLGAENGPKHGVTTGLRDTPDARPGLTAEQGVTGPAADTGAQPGLNAERNTMGSEGSPSHSGGGQLRR
jgi:hypothetical protein